MNVSEAIKSAYKNNTHAKILTIIFPDIDYTVPTNEVYYESMTLDEAIFDEDSFEAVGCIASQFSVSIRDTGLNLKDELITVSMSLNGIADSEIPLFYGYVDSVEREAQKKMQKITAYDPLYSLGNTNVIDWYNNLTYPISLKTFRDSLFNLIGITQITATLPNDDIIINKEFTPKSLTALGVIKALCQINGCFGMMNRTGSFEYRYLNQTNTTVEQVTYYRSMNYSDYVVNPVDKLTIRQSTEDAGITVGEGDNEYIIQGNMFTYNLSPATIYDIAHNIYPYLSELEYIPFNASNNGYPWIELGDNCILDYSVYDFDNSTSSQEVYKDVTVIAMRRSMKGIQNLIDTYSAEGSELQREFVSDLSVELDILQQTVDNIVNQLSSDIFTYRNGANIAVSEGVATDIADFVYKSKEGNTVLFHEEASLIVVADDPTIAVEAEVNYYVNGRELPTHGSEGYLLNGKHILSLMQFWLAGVNETNRFQVKLTVTGGSVSIQKFRAQAYISIKQSDYDAADIEVAHNPNKTSYRIGETLDFTGLVINKVYQSEGSSAEDVTSDCSFSPSEGSTVTSTDMITVTATYSEITELGDVKTYATEFYLDVVYLIGISVAQEPTKTEYYVGDNLDLSGIQVVADYSDGSTADVTSQCSYVPSSGYTFASIDEGEIQITYTEDGIMAETSTFVTVEENPAPPYPLALKYLTYTVSGTTIRVNGLNVQEIAADDLRNLEIPASFTDNGVTYNLVIDGYNYT